MEFGSDDDEASPALIAQLQDMISTGQFPDEPQDKDRPKKSKKSKDPEEEPEEEGKVHSVFVGNLLPSVTRTELVSFIESVAVPIQARVLMQNRGGRQTAVSFMDFQKASEAKAIVAKFNNKDFKGKPLQVRLANDRKLAPAPAAGESVYVRNLAFQTTEETLKKLFSPCGEILQIRLPIFEDTGKHRGYGFVDYKEKDGAKKALSLNRKEVDGRQILVEPALKREAPRAESMKSEWCGESLTFDE
jgi:nucleolin